MPWLTGTAYWPFKDFSTPVRPANPIPYVNQKGVIERDFTPKESYYVFSLIGQKKPMLHIYGHSWPVRWGMMEMKKKYWYIQIVRKVELFVNGESQGIHQRDSQDFPAAGLRWNVKLKNGLNTLRAVTVDTKESLTDELTLNIKRRNGEKLLLSS